MINTLKQWLGKPNFLDRQILRSGHEFDHSLLWMVVLLTAFSLIMIYSASVSGIAIEDGNTWYFLLNQVKFVGVALLCAFITFIVPLNKQKQMVWPVLIVSIILLVLVLFVGRRINGAIRWISLGPVNFQPTELFKLAVVMYMASFFTRKAEILKHLKKVWWVSLPVACGLFLIMQQPDFGSFVVVSVIAVGLLFLAGLPWTWFVTVIAVGLLGIGSLILGSSYRLKRVQGFLDPWADPYDKGYQLIQSLLSVSRGGWFGEGIGSGVVKRTLPEAHTDFIFAVIGEEFGIFGLVILTFVFIWLVIRAFSIGKQANDLELFYGSFVAQGIGIWLGVQSFFNLGVNLGMLPTKGLTLPLISYGGSSVLVMFVCIAMLLRVDYENRRKMRGFKVKT